MLEEVTVNASNSYILVMRQCMCVQGAVILQHLGFIYIFVCVCPSPPKEYHQYPEKNVAKLMLQLSFISDVP